MTDPAGSWRPAIPKKPADVRVSVVTSNNNASNTSSAALRGATRAFNATSPHTPVATSTKSQPGARAAASVAGLSSRPNSVPPQDVRTRDDSGLRGRQMNNNPILAARDALRSSSQNKKFSPERSVPGRSPSAIAARMASASSSPSRRLGDSSGSHGSPQREPMPALPIRSNSSFTPVSQSAIGASPQNLTPQSFAIPHAPARSPLFRSQSPISFDLNDIPTLSPPGLMNTRRAQSPTKTPQAAVVSASAAASSAVASADAQSKLRAKQNGNYFTLTDAERTAPVAIKPPPRSRTNIASPQLTPSGHHRDFHSNMTEQTLADAIVASSVASSRHVSPPRRPHKPPLPLRRSKSHSFVTPRQLEVWEKPPLKSPPVRPFRQTLRKQSKPEDDEEETKVAKLGRRHYFRKHQHKHHEGDRRRWRDKVTERERRRYEGLWAANKGLYLFWKTPEGRFGGSQPTAAETDLVVNVVVRDIWERSRLPRDVLEEVWSLVAPNDEAVALKRDEFVVGLWLIDQRLKGRKLPPSISQSVWGSVRHSQGLKVSRKPL